MLKTLSETDASLVLVHFMTTAVSFSDVWARLDIPVVIHCHGYDVSWDLRFPDGEKPAHDEEYVSRVRALPDNAWFIANSSYTRSRLLEIGVDPGRIFNKRFGVPLAPAPRLHREEDSPELLYLGRLVDCKGPLETIQAFHQCSRSHHNATLRIAGDGPLLGEVRELLAWLGLDRCTEQLGAVDASRARMLRNSATIFTAHNRKGPNTLQEEAFGVSLLEAMASGLPVVTGRSGGIPDFIESGENGLLFDPGDIDGHAAILDELLASPKKRQAIGRAAWETVRDRFKPEHELADLQAIFTAVLNGHPSSLSVGRRAA
jgi:glycosyltransferase involved in cell wall biosynthesis